MKKVKIHNKIVEEAKEREKRWKELRNFMDKYQDVKTQPKEIPEVKKNIEKEDNEVDKFLKSIGLEKYSKIMQENGIDDIEILQELTESHLEGLGIVLGHRIKILKKIKEINEINKPEEMKIKIIDKEPSSEKKNIRMLKQEGFPQNDLKFNQKSIFEIQNPTNFISENEKKISIEQPTKIHIEKSKTVEYVADSPVNKERKVEQMPLNNKIPNQEIGINAISYTLRDTKAPLYPNKKEAGTDIIQLDNVNNNKSPIVTLHKLPMSNKPITVGKSFSTYQPSSQEVEKNIKLSEIIENAPTVKPKEELNWEGFSYVPYKPSEEIQASINKPSSRPSSATHKIENRTNEKLAQKNLEKTPSQVTDKFEVIGWDN